MVLPAEISVGLRFGVRSKDSKFFGKHGASIAHGRFVKGKLERKIQSGLLFRGNLAQGSFQRSEENLIRRMKTIHSFVSH